MLSFLTSVVLAASVSTPVAQLGAPEGRAARLVAQVDLPAPPPPPPLIAPATSQRMSALQNEIDDLSSQLLKLPSRFWPSYSVVLTVLGGLTLAGGLVATWILATVTVPVVGIAISVGGLALLVVGIATGVSTVGAADAERERLLERRDALELELRTLRRQSARPDVEPTLELARF